MTGIDGQPDYDDMKACLKILRQHGKEGANISGYVAALDPANLDLAEFILIEYDSKTLINRKLLYMMEQILTWDWAKRQDELNTRWQLVANVIRNCHGGSTSLSDKVRSEIFKVPASLNIEFSTLSELTLGQALSGDMMSNMISSDLALYKRKRLQPEINKMEQSNGLH